MKRVWAVLALVTILALVAACAAPTPQVIEKVVEKTVVVEKPVEKVVQATVVVEKPVEKVVQVTAAPANYGKVTILSTQANPVEEQEKMRGVVLKAFPGKPEFIGMEEPALIDRVLAEAKAGKGTADVLISLHGTYPTLLAANALLDLSDMVPNLKDRNIPEAFMKLGKLGTDKQYYIPVMQATYIMAANRQALEHKPSAFFTVNVVARKPGKDFLALGDLALHGAAEIVRLTQLLGQVAVAFSRRFLEPGDGALGDAGMTATSTATCAPTAPHSKDPVVASRAASTSLWSASRVMGAASARDTLTSTNGVRQPAQVQSISRP